MRQKKAHSHHKTRFTWNNLGYIMSESQVKSLKQGKKQLKLLDQKKYNYF